MLSDGRSVVEPSALAPFAGWENFYVIIGSSAAALTGLQFVVIVLGAEARSVRGPELGAFGTPTVVHFCAVLLISAILSVPWRAIGSGGLALRACGVGGITHMGVVIKRGRGQKPYPPGLRGRPLPLALSPLTNFNLLVAALRAPPRHP